MSNTYVDGPTGFIYLVINELEDQAAIIACFGNTGRGVTILPCHDFDEFLALNSLCTGGLFVTLHCGDVPSISVVNLILLAHVSRNISLSTHSGLICQQFCLLFGGPCRRSQIQTPLERGNHS